VIYVDTSVVLAYLLEEGCAPAATFWREPLVSSRLLHYETWCRIRARAAAKSHGDDARSLLAGIALVELSPPVLARALEPFPVTVRTLDALHLASADFLRAHGQEVLVASYDERLSAAADAMGLARFPLD
jgi:predicted nucleic acid-binding protein